MDGVPNPVSSSLIACEESNGHFISSDAPDAYGHTVIFSYAPPDMVRQAKLEAMEMKVRRKMLERKASLLDTHALSDVNVNPVASPAVRVSARDNTTVVSRDLVKSLVVPPSYTEHGDEVRGSSEFILDGERLQYQRPGRVAADASQTARPLPYFRTYETSKGTSMTGSMKKKPWGAAEGGGGTEATPPGRKNRSATSGVGDPYWGAGGGGVGFSGAGASGRGKERTGTQELKAQLSDGMMSYVPSKFQRPKDVERTAFVPQGQAMEEARHNYETVKQRRPASAPPRRAAAGAAAAKAANAAEGSGRNVAGVADGVIGALVGGMAAGRAGADGAPGTAAPRSKKWMDVTVVVAEETDLFAMYRQRSQQQQQQQHATFARSSSDRLRGTSSRSLTPAVAKGPAAAAASSAAAGRGKAFSRPMATAGTGGRNPAASPTSRKNMASPPRGSAAEGGRPGGAGARSRQRPASTAPAVAAASAKGAIAVAGGGASSTAYKKQPPRQTASPARPKVPATAAEAAATAAAAAGRPWSARAATAWDAPRPPSPSKTPTSSRPPSQRRISAPAGTAATSDGASGAAARSVWQPMDPETRLQRQTRPGSAINTAKTNRVRGPPARLDGSGARGAAQPTWTTSTSSGAGGSCDRSQLQERILGGLIRQYTLEEDEEETQAAAAAAIAAVDAGTVVMPPRRPVRPRATDTAAAGGSLLASQRSRLGSGVGSAQDEVQQQQQPAYGNARRPQSAPNRRLRPPSPGHWAGRPDPDTLLSRTGAQHTTTGLGILYDPELHPSPLDSYVNQLKGLD